MEKRKEIIAELDGIAPRLANMPPVNAYQVPEGYFETLAEVILGRVAPAAGKTMTVPNGYFDTLPLVMLQKVRMMEQQVELKEIAPTLAVIPKSMPYTVPDGYFEQLPGQLQAATYTKEQSSPNIGLVRPMFGKMLRYAAAAILLMGVFGIYQALQPAKVDNTATVFSNNAGDTIGEADALLMQLSSLDDDLITESLTDIGVTEDTRPALLYLNTTDFESALQGISTEALKNDLQREALVNQNI